MNHGLTVISLLRGPMFFPRFIWLVVSFLPRGPRSGIFQVAYAAIGRYTGVAAVREFEHVHVCGVMHLKCVSCEMRNIACRCRWLPTAIVPNPMEEILSWEANSDSSTGVTLYRVWNPNCHAVFTRTHNWTQFLTILTL